MGAAFWAAFDVWLIQVYRHPVWPWGIMTVNSPGYLLLGGFTIFSTFILPKEGCTFLAAGYVLVSVRMGKKFSQIGGGAR